MVELLALAIRWPSVAELVFVFLLLWDLGGCNYDAQFAVVVALGGDCFSQIT